MAGLTTATHSDLRQLRVDHTGGFRKPERLLDVYRRFARGEATDEEVLRIQDECVRQLIATEEAHNLPVLSDGEYRRRQFQESFGEAVTGFDADPGSVYVQQGPREEAPTRRVESGPTSRGPAVLHRRPVTRRLELVRNVPLEEYRQASPLTDRPLKVTLVGPDRVSQRFEWESSSAWYSGLEDFTDHVVQLQRQMVAELVDAGCPYIQLDEPGYTAYVDERLLDAMRSRGEDPARNLARSIAADNAIVDGFRATNTSEGSQAATASSAGGHTDILARSADARENAGSPGAAGSSVTFGIHICRGGGSSGYHRDGRYDAIAEQLFGSLRFDRLLLEYDTESSGSFEALRFVASDSVVVLGLISTRVSAVESVDDLQRRIEAASKYLPIEQLALGPRCGLGLPEEAIWRKVDVMLETANRVWG
jgi:5-methyltetrahydropteroyltriglutamate--homocysteine methyltransferase